MRAQDNRFPFGLWEGLGEGLYILAPSAVRCQPLPRPNTRSAMPPAWPEQRGALFTSRSQAEGEK